jgi:hypothetical protein
LFWPRAAGSSEVRLGPADKEVAQTGASIGHEFGDELLASITDLPEPQLNEALDRLTSSSGLLFVHGTPSQSSYALAGCCLRHVVAQSASGLHAPRRWNN